MRTMHVIVAVVLLASIDYAYSAQIVIVDPPGAIGADAEDINSAGYILGGFVDGNGFGHAYVRSPAGSYTVIDRFAPFSINGVGQVVGQYGNGGGIRAPDGTITAFFPPNSHGTYPYGINHDGWIAGSYLLHPHKGNTGGFIRAPDGTITEFRTSRSTAVRDINGNGTAVGGDSDGFAFTRDSDGIVTRFQVPGPYPTAGVSINREGFVTGYFNSGNLHGFVRAPDGSFTIFNPKQSVDTIPYSINNKGSVTGLYAGQDNLRHGFVRSRGGRITTFDPPGSTDTEVRRINASGSIVGYFLNGQGAHAFLRIP